MNIVLAGTQNWDLMWGEKQQHATRLAQRGHRILYIDPAWIHKDTSSWSDRVRELASVRNGLGLRELVPDSLYVFTYHYARLLRWRLNVRRHRRTLRKLTERLSFASPVMLVMHPDALPLMDLVQPRASVYLAVDEYTAYGGITPDQASWLRGQEEEVLRRSEVALGVSPRLVERFRQIQPRSYILENAVVPEQFSPERLATLTELPELAALPRPRLGFIGQIDDRLDQDIVLHLARSRPEWQIVLVGRIKAGVDVSALLEVPNIHFLPFQTHDKLPNVLRSIDVCLVPYRANTLTQSCNPAKIFEYLATGLPIVSTPLEGIGSPRPAISLAAAPEAFLQAVEEALADPAAGRERRLATAAENHWDTRCDQLERHLEEALQAAQQCRP